MKKIVGPVDIITDILTESPHFDQHDISSCNGTGKVIASIINTRKTRGLDAARRKVESIQESDPLLYCKLRGEPTTIEEPDSEQEKKDARLITNKYGKKRFPTFKQSDIDNFPDIEFAIKDILPSTGVSLLVAPSGTGKTYLLIDLANHIARGMEWNKRQTKSGQVLFIYLEGKLGLKPREKAWRTFHDMGMTDNIDYMSVPMDFMKDHQYIDAVIEELQQEKGVPYSLIIVDTFSNVTRGVDQNKQELVTMVLEVFHLIADKWQTQVLVTHHTNKQGSANGSMSFKNHVDTMIELSTPESQSNGPITVHCEKQRDGAPPFEDFRLQRQLVEIGFNAETLEPLFNCVLVASESGMSQQEAVERNEQEQMLDLLKVHTKLSARAWISACKEVGVSQKTFYKHIPTLTDKGKIVCTKAVRSGQADYYEISPEIHDLQEPCTP